MRGIVRSTDLRVGMRGNSTAHTAFRVVMTGTVDSPEGMKGKGPATLT